MKNKLLLIAKILAVIIITSCLGILLIYLYLCRTVAISTTKKDPAKASTYSIVDTAQSSYWNSEGSEIIKPSQNENFYGQDAEFQNNMPSYRDNGDGTITDNVTGLMWTQSLDLNGDGQINSLDKRTLPDAITSSKTLNVGGYSDWKIPTVKELYSLINFNGVDGKIYDSTNAKPFIDTNYFKFGYGDTSAGERNIDAQVATQTIYVDKTFIGFQTMFGVNFADGRIKGYPLTVSMTGITESKFYIYYVRGNNSYGINDFSDNKDKTITDNATNLMWSKDDSGTGMNWEESLKWVQTKNSENYLGHSDWRLPNIKELQSIVDYSRSPSITNSASIDPIFNITKINNENGVEDYGYFWSSTTHISVSDTGNLSTGYQSSYIPFGRGIGKMIGIWMDVHGAGSQRSELKSGNASDYPDGFGPQGDAIRINNYVRLVREVK
ncbi:MAG: DUF1566 domain-containing protein [bacterium]